MKKRLSTYWWCQISGWSAYILFCTCCYFFIPALHTHNFFPAFFLKVLAGIFITHIMRLIITKAKLLQLNILKQIVYIFFTTIFFSFVYTLITIWFDRVLHWENVLFNAYSFWNKTLIFSFGYSLV